MIDPFAASLDALSAGSPLAIPAVFAAGVCTSVGPCVAPRYVALAALASGPRRTRVIAAFIAGVVGAYVAIGYAAEELRSLVAHRTAIDIMLAAVLSIAGIVTVTRARPAHPCTFRAASGSSPGGSFLLGAASSLVISPCCTPMLAAIAAAPGTSARPAFGSVLLAAFGIGHALPLALAAFGPGIFTPAFRRLGSAQAPGIIAGSLMLALGAYYGLLA